tara:strand:- start:30 stop:389 length:360 start_codon:yes stop_codon:yes gene_type:complete
MYLTKYILIIIFFLQYLVIANTIEFNEEFRLINHFESWEDIKYKNVIRQSEDNSCGAASLATILHMKHYFITEKDILNLLSEKGSTSFLDLINVANHYGFSATGILVSFKKLLSLKILI